MSRVLAVASVLATWPLSAAGPQTFDLDWFTIDGGGMVSTGAGIELGATVGQPDAGPVMTGGGFELTGGFWPGTSAGASPPGDCDADGDVDLDDYAGFPACMTGPSGAATPLECGCVDLNADGQVDLLDYAEFQTVLEGAP